MVEQVLQPETDRTEIELLEGNETFRILVGVFYQLLKQPIGTVEDAGHLEALAWAEALRLLLDEFEDYHMGSANPIEEVTTDAITLPGTM